MQIRLRRVKENAFWAVSGRFAPSRFAPNSKSFRSQLKVDSKSFRPQLKVDSIQSYINKLKVISPPTQICWNCTTLFLTWSFHFIIITNSITIKPTSSALCLDRLLSYWLIEKFEHWNSTEYIMISLVIDMTTGMEALFSTVIVLQLLTKNMLPKKKNTRFVLIGYCIDYGGSFWWGWFNSNAVCYDNEMKWPC